MNIWIALSPTETTVSVATKNRIIHIMANSNAIRKRSRGMRFGLYAKLRDQPDEFRCQRALAAVRGLRSVRCHRSLFREEEGA